MKLPKLTFNSQIYFFIYLFILFFLFIYFLFFLFFFSSLFMCLFVIKFFRCVYMYDYVCFLVNICQCLCMYIAINNFICAFLCICNQRCRKMFHRHQEEFIKYSTDIDDITVRLLE